MPFPCPLQFPASHHAAPRRVSPTPYRKQSGCRRRGQELIDSTDPNAPKEESLVYAMPPRKPVQNMNKKPAVGLTFLKNMLSSGQSGHIYEKIQRNTPACPPVPPSRTGRHPLAKDLPHRPGFVHNLRQSCRLCTAPPTSVIQFTRTVPYTTLQPFSPAQE